MVQTLKLYMNKDPSHNMYHESKGYKFVTFHVGDVFVSLNPPRPFSYLDPTGSKITQHLFIFRSHTPGHIISG